MADGLDPAEDPSEDALELMELLLVRCEGREGIAVAHLRGGGECVIDTPLAEAEPRPGGRLLLAGYDGAAVLLRPDAEAVTWAPLKPEDPPEPDRWAIGGPCGFGLPGDPEA